MEWSAEFELALVRWMDAWRPSINLLEAFETAMSTVVQQEMVPLKRELNADARGVSESIVASDKRLADARHEIERSIDALKATLRAELLAEVNALKIQDVRVGTSLAVAGGFTKLVTPVVCVVLGALLAWGLTKI